MSSIDSANLAPDDGPFGATPEIDESELADYVALTDEDFVDDDDAIDITESDGPVLEDGDDLS
jgi:hypothetical protein